MRRTEGAQPRIGVCERAASGVSKLVEFDGYSVIGMPDSKLANSAKLTILMRLQATDQSVIQNVIGSTSQMLIRLLTGGTLDIVIRNSAGTSIYSKTTAANFRTTDGPRWAAISLDLSNAAVEVTQLVTWAVPATATTDSAVSSALTADTTTAFVARLDQPLAIGHSTAAAGVGGVFGKFRLGDLMIWRDYIDFTVLSTRQVVSDSAGLPQASWVAGGGVLLSKTPDLRLQGNAGDFRQGRMTGGSAPSSPGAAGQYLAHSAERRANGEYGYLVSI